MANSSILGGDPIQRPPPGHDREALGPSDSSDTGSDVQGYADSQPPIPDSNEDLQQEMQGDDSDTDATGDRASVILSEHVRDGADIAPDQIVDAEHAGVTGAPDTLEPLDEDAEV